MSFIKEKADWNKRLRDLLAGYNSSKGIAKRLEAALSKMTEEQIESMESNPNEAMSALTKAIDEVRTVSIGVEKVKPNLWEDKLAAINKAIAAAEMAATTAGEVHAAVKYLLQEKSKKVKAANNTKHYKKLRIANKMSSRGHGTHASTFLAGELQSILGAKKVIDIARDPTDSEFDQGSLTLFTAKSAAWVGDAFGEGVRQGMVERIASLREVLADTPRWGGAMVRHDPTIEKLQSIEILKRFEVDFSHKGSYPWVTAARSLHWRHGPAAWPMTGFASLVRAEVEGSGCDLLVFCVPAESILSKGIALTDLHSFLETPSGQGVAESACKVVHLKAREVLWVPFGYLCIPVVTKCETDDPDDGDGDDNKESKESKEKNEKKRECDAGLVGAFTVLTIFSDALKDSVSDRAWKAIHSFNGDYLNKHGNKPAWGSRKQLFDTLKSPSS